MKRNLFTDESLEKSYHSKGYIHIPNFLSGDETNQLISLYKKKEKSFFDKGFHRTLDMTNIKKKKEVCNAINNIIYPASQKYLNKYKYLLTSFMTKEKKANEFDIHQNWTFVEEDKFTSLVIWIPLQDVSEHNGTLYFVEGSDKWDKGIRGNNIPWMYESQKESLLQNMIAVPMKKGDAVIFDDATIHYTSPNFSTSPRISIAQVMIPEEANPIFYTFNQKNNTIDKYAIDDSFYITFMNKVKDNTLLNDLILLDSISIQK